MFKQNRCYDKSANFNGDTNYNFNQSMNNVYPEAEMGANMPNYMGQPNMGCMNQPIYECPQERVCHKEIVHEVPHVCPINTRIVNHHIYRHTYTPCYTCCEENVCSNVYEGSCCNF